MAVVLAALGGFVYVRVGSTLLSSADQTLAGDAATAHLRLQLGRPLLDRDAAAAGSVAQVLTAAGAVATSDPSPLPAILDRSQAASVGAGATLRTTTAISGERGRWRVLAIPVSSGRAREVLVLGSSLATRDESLERLRHELLFSSPLALLIATLAGYVLAGAALRPVEAMRRKAEAISAATPGTRLPVPPARDEVSRLAETINEMLARLETAFEHERRFIAEASHELRTPLALLRTELDLALRKPRSREDLEEALRSAAEETDRLTALAADLLSSARSESGALPVHPEPLMVAELLERVAARFAARAAELGRRVTVEPPDGVVLEADRERLEQALDNLVENALLHGRGAVTLSTHRNGASLELHVRDDGGGFPPEFAPRAFDRFSRADDARSRSGSGLGLAIVRTIARAHGGQTGITPRDGGGADVWIELPLAPPPAPRARVHQHLGARRRRGTAVAVGGVAAAGPADEADAAAGSLGSLEER